MRRCGTESGYSGGCRCVLCKAAHTQVRRNRRSRELDREAGIEPPPREPYTYLPPVIPIGPWHEQAACKGEGWLFLMPNDRTQRNRGRLPDRCQTAIATCFDCPVLEQCEQWAFAHHIDPCPHHILAGLTPRQRNIRRRHLGYLMPGPTGGAA